MDVSQQGNISNYQMLDYQRFYSIHANEQQQRTNKIEAGLA